MVGAAPPPSAREERLAKSKAAVISTLPWYGLDRAKSHRRVLLQQSFMHGKGQGKATNVWDNKKTKGDDNKFDCFHLFFLQQPDR